MIVPTVRQVSTHALLQLDMMVPTVRQVSTHALLQLGMYDGIHCESGKYT